MTSRFTLGTWRPLLGGRGMRFAVAGNRVAAAELARLVVWEGQRVIAQRQAPAQEPGWPRFVDQRVCWGEGVLDVSSGVYHCAKGVSAALLHGVDASSEAPPGGGYLPVAYGWSPDGETLVVSTSWSGTVGSFPARVLLLDREGSYQRTLWQGFDLAPQAVWVGNRNLVVGSRELRVYDRQGELSTMLTTGAPVRIEACRDEARLLVVEHGRLSLWRSSVWSMLDTVDGNWLDAAIAPGGDIVATVNYAGQLSLARVEDGLSSLTHLPTPDPVRSLTLGEDCLVAGFARGDAVRVADLNA